MARSFSGVAAVAKRLPSTGVEVRDRTGLRAVDLMRVVDGDECRMTVATVRTSAPARMSREPVE
ncbi:MAG: hypothetical protein M3N13_09765 [Candidatus Eremiobacteraeota bacterium]|nr:hypothetical protein [Candidatus Eremiobacteraeota bacterium]